jgi:hypothetical protein
VRRSRHPAVALTFVLLAASISAAGCGSGSSGTAATPTPLHQVISALVAHEDSRGGNPGEGPLFCRAGYLGGKLAGRRFRLYVWEACQQYRAIGHARLVEGVGWSAPAVITVRATGHGYRIVGDEQPPYLYLGSYYDMFPDPKIRAKIETLDSGMSSGSVSPPAMFAAIKRQAQRELLGQ